MTSDEIKLKRLIYLNNVSPKYNAGQSRTFAIESPNAEFIETYVENSCHNVITILTSLNDDKLIPNRSVLFYIFAKALSSNKIQIGMKSQVTAAALKLCKSDEEFFDFIQHCTTFKGKRKITTSVRKAIRNFYKNKTPEDLAKSYAFSTSFHSWNHKSLIKLAFIKSETPLKNLVINYILFKKNPEETMSEEKKKVLDVLINGDKVRKTKDPKEIIPILKDLKLTHKQLTPEVEKSHEAWEAVLPHMKIQDILTSVFKLFKLGLLKANSTTQNKVIEILNSPEKVKASNIHPVEVYIHLKNFEKGGKPIDPKLVDHLVKEKNFTEDQINKIKTFEPKCQLVLNSIYKCLSLSYNNVKSTGKRYMITIDTTDKMDLPCLYNKNIKTIEAALAITMSILKVEKEVIVATFKEKEINVIQLEKTASFQDNLKKLRDNKAPYVIPILPVEWAARQNKHIDVFITFVNYHDYFNFVPKECRGELLGKIDDVITRYKKKTNLQNAKIAMMSMASSRLHFGNGSPNRLDIAGFDVGIPKVLEAFAKGNFV